MVAVNVSLNGWWKQVIRGLFVLVAFHVGERNLQVVLANVVKTAIGHVVAVGGCCRWVKIAVLFP